MNNGKGDQDLRVKMESKTDVGGPQGRGRNKDCRNEENGKRVEQVKIELLVTSTKNSRWESKGQFDFLIFAHKDMG